MLYVPETFVVERRLAEPSELVDLVASTGTLLPNAGASIRLGQASLVIAAPLRRTLGSFDLAWRTEAILRNQRGRRVARIDVTVDAWSADATRLQLRPAARHPERWSRRRLRQYFPLAHAAADALGTMLLDRARAPQLWPQPLVLVS